ncbi:MAG: hypothetical protein GY710_10430 [Desulfobacteraceae bacterium]|nr:hypothetical protein [Desulfobacteraceae bacterium]
MPEFLKVKKHKSILNYYILWLPFIIIYQVTNRFHFFEPRQLTMTTLDESIPFLPWTIPIYISYLVYTFIVIARSKDDDEVRDIFILTHIQLGLAVLFFIFFPVGFPRDQFYYTHPLTSMFNSFWVLFDGPSNCLPSLHTILCLTAIRHSSNKPKTKFYTAWGIMIIATTLTCKQHYIVDVLAGFAIYWLSLKIFFFYGNSRSILLKKKESFD